MNQVTRPLISRNQDTRGSTNSNAERVPTMNRVMTIRCIDKDSEGASSEKQDEIKVNHQDLEMIRMLNESESISQSQVSNAQKVSPNQVEHEPLVVPLNDDQIFAQEARDASQKSQKNDLDEESSKRHEVYEEMKNLNINRDQLIKLMRQEDPCDQRKNDWLSSKKLKQAEEMKSTYTLSTIETCQDINFLLLLLKNYSRGTQNSDIIENIVNKIAEKLENKNESIKDLNTKNMDLVKLNKQLTTQIMSLNEQLKEQVAHTQKFQKALFEREQKINTLQSEGSKQNVIKSEQDKKNSKAGSAKSSCKNADNGSFKRMMSMQSLEIHKDDIKSNQKKDKKEDIGGGLQRIKSNIPKNPTTPTRTQNNGMARNEVNQRQKQPKQQIGSIELNKSPHGHDSDEISDTEISIHKRKRGPPIFVPKQFGNMMSSAKIINVVFEDMNNQEVPLTLPTQRYNEPNFLDDINMQPGMALNFGRRDHLMTERNY